MGMDLVNGLLNLVAPPLTFFTLLTFLPPWLFFNFCLRILTLFFPEDVSGKVVLITGASSGIGEYVAYEYARRGACLALGARRTGRLREVAHVCRQMGSPDVITAQLDVSNFNDCKRMLLQTITHFGRLDHLVNNAGISQVSMLEDYADITMLGPVVDINFWGSVYMTRLAAPHLRNTRGRIIGMSSSASWLPLPRQSLYNATKAALAQFYETLRVEFGSDIKITVVTPGLVESELTQGKFLTEKGDTVVNHVLRDVQVNMLPVAKVEDCAKEIVKGATRGKRYVTVPRWMEMTYVWRMLWPEAVDWSHRLFQLGVGPLVASLAQKAMKTS